MTVSLSSVADVLARIRGARDVAFGSYLLNRGPVRDALTDAARGGSHVEVTLQADPYRNDYGTRINADAARSLRDAGATVSLLPRETAPFHLKAAVCDGVAYLDDRNFTQRGPEIVVADDAPRDVALVREGLAGRGGADRTLATRKDEALRREQRLVDSARGLPLVVETERVGNSPLTAALRRHARSGAPTTLILGRGTVSARERGTIAALRSDGVVVRTTGTNEKLALAGERAWLGSVNATGAFGRGAGQIEFGMLTRNRALVGAVRDALSRDMHRPA